MFLTYRYMIREYISNIKNVEQENGLVEKPV